MRTYKSECLFGSLLGVYNACFGAVVSSTAFPRAKSLPDINLFGFVGL